MVMAENVFALILARHFEYETMEGALFSLIYILNECEQDFR